MVEIISEKAGVKEIGRAFNVSRESLEKLQIYADLLAKWQKKINLVGPQEIARIWPRHIADALQLLPHIPANASVGADLGTGAGIPGVILAIALKKKLHVHLIESNGKKAAFLREVIRRLDIPAQVHCDRVEKLYQEEWVGSVDVVFARALAPLPKLIDLAQPILKKSGKLLFLKGLDVDSELTETTKYWNIGYEKYPSRTSVGGCILSIKDFQRVKTSSSGSGLK